MADKKELTPLEKLRAAESTQHYRIQLTTEMLGTVPKNPEIYKAWIESMKPEEISEDEAVAIEKIDDKEAKGWTGFRVDENGKGLFIYDYMIKGFLKAAGNVSKNILEVKALRNKIDDFVFIFPRRIYLGQQEPDGIVERPLRVGTPKGERVTLARSDKINEGKIIEFDITLVTHKEISWDIIDALFIVRGEKMGLGQFRNGSYGRFTVLDITRDGKIVYSKPITEIV